MLPLPGESVSDGSWPTVARDRPLWSTRALRLLAAGSGRPTGVEDQIRAAATFLITGLIGNTGRPEGCYRACSARVGIIAMIRRGQTELRRYSNQLLQCPPIPTVATQSLNASAENLAKLRFRLHLIAAACDRCSPLIGPKAIAQLDRLPRPVLTKGHNYNKHRQERQRPLT